MPTDSRCDILFSGTGYFAEIMACDIAATARTPLRVVIGGRNAGRMKWLVDACRARAAIHGTPVRFESVELDSTSAEALMPPLDALRPRVFVQSASAQSPWSVDIGESEWSHLVARAGFGMTIAFHALLAWRAASAIKALGLDTYFVNTCYPDGVNPLLVAAGAPLTTGVGNIGIFAAVVASRLPEARRSDLRVLGHHRHIVEWRKPVGTRAGAPIRAWAGAEEIADVETLTQDIQLPYRDLNIISGASAVPVLLALVGEGRRRVHVPGPMGLPGGYPVQADAEGVALDLPPGLGREGAIDWNRQFEEADGVGIHDGRVVYSERARTELGRHSAELAAGFAAGEIEEAAAALQALRARLGGG
jgi:hypothetical protein